MGNIFLCALCDRGGTLLRLKPSKWYSCQDCVRKYGGDRHQTLIAVVDRLRDMARRNDPRLDIPANQEAIMSMGKDLLIQLRKPL